MFPLQGPRSAEKRCCQSWAAPSLQKNVTESEMSNTMISILQTNMHTCRNVTAHDLMWQMVYERRIDIVLLTKIEAHHRGVPIYLALRLSE